MNIICTLLRWQITPNEQCVSVIMTMKNINEGCTVVSCELLYNRMMKVAQLIKYAKESYNQYNLTTSIVDTPYW